MKKTVEMSRNVDYTAGKYYITPNIRNIITLLSPN